MATTRSTSAKTGASAGTDLLEGMNVGALFEIGSSSEAESIPEAWQPPEMEELAACFPAHEFLKFLGRGGMGAVYLARQKSLDRMVTIKILPTEASTDEAFVQRFHREARTLAKLNHPGIVDIHDFGTTSSGQFYLVMEYVEGPDLAHVIGSQPLEPEPVRSYMMQICEALEYAHVRGIVHRDIKPSNILLNNTEHIKVADFGLAKMIGYEPEAGMQTRTGATIGTPGYAAPEQMKPGRTIDHRADIFSVGVLLYEMLAGDLPRGIFEPLSKKCGLDPRWDSIVHRAMQENPEARYPSIREMLAELKNICPEPAKIPAHSPARPGRRWFWFVMAGILALGSLAGLYFFSKSRAHQPPVPKQVALPTRDLTPSDSMLAVPPAPPIEKPRPPDHADQVYGNKTYRFIEQPETWERAVAMAKKLGGIPACATNPELNAWLAATFASKTRDGIFLGAHCGVPGGSWEWLDGSPWNFTNWNAEPPIFGALVQTPTGSWTSSSFEDKRPFVISFPNP